MTLIAVGVVKCALRLSAITIGFVLVIVIDALSPRKKDTELGVTVSIVDAAAPTLTNIVSTGDGCE